MSGVNNLPLSEVFVTALVHYEGRLTQKIMFNENGVYTDYIEKTYKKCHIYVSLDIYYWYYVFHTVKSFDSYRKTLLENLSHITGKKSIRVAIHVTSPKKELMDKAWAERLTTLVAEKHELDAAMSWLSTLGGAFSSLGDNFQHCAKIAGNISVQQFKLALRLGEEPLLVRCRIYMALSMIQQGNLHEAKQIILNQYSTAKKLKDERLQNMCKGVWAKLKYTKKLQKKCLE